MLQKDPSRRPSASELHDATVPPLLEAIQIKEGILLPTEPSGDDSKEMKSFLYYLDGHSLSFQPVSCPIQDKITHVKLIIIITA